jgi:L-fucose mutarotase/ribose pyranase (RbsD/FucU family)
MNGNPLSPSECQNKLKSSLRVFGHRNWIVIADAAYPHQSCAGIETLAVEMEQIELVRMVLKSIAASRHLRACVYTDLELKFVSEQDAPGVTAYRLALEGLLEHSEAKQIAHEEIIARLDERARAFRGLILKSSMAIPYTSVFCELECGYWNAEAEEQLRRAITRDAQPA